MNWGSRKLADLLPGQKLRKYLPHDLLSVALKDMAENDFSQVIVRDAHGLTLVTVQGVTQWLAQWVEVGRVTLIGVELQDVLEYEHVDNRLVMSGENTILEALGAFETAIKEGQPRLYAIIVTRDGDPTREPIAIITPEDLVE
jgi:hypothetical protein